MLERYKTASCSSEAISLFICYAILLVLSVFCFPKTNLNIQSFRTVLSFYLGRKAVEKQKRRRKHVQWQSTAHSKSPIPTKPQFLASLPEILNLPFAHNYNSLRVSSRASAKISPVGGFPLDSLAKSGFPSLYMQDCFAKSGFLHT